MVTNLANWERKVTFSSQPAIRTDRFPWKLGKMIIKFLNNLGDFSEEQGESLHQDVGIMEERYQGRRDEHTSTYDGRVLKKST
jgi:hypothetical protein